MNNSVLRSCEIKNKKNLRQSDILSPIRQPKYIHMNLQRRKKISKSLTKSFFEKFNNKLRIN